MRRLVAALCSLGCSYACLGCTVGVEPLPEVSPPAVVAQGELSITWTVNGDSGSSACALAGADGLELVVTDENGATVAVADAACDANEVTVSLPEGRYEARVTLTDARNAPVTVEKPLEALDVTEGSKLNVDLDFPLGSVLPDRRRDG